MRILDRYINKSILAIFLSGVVLFCLLYVLIDVTSTLDEIIDRKVPFKVLVEYYITYLPTILIEMSSAACLIATVFTYSKLNASNEIIVMRSSGLDFWQVTKPAIFLGLLISALVFWLNEEIVPQSTLRLKEIQADYMVSEADRATKKSKIIKDLTFYGLQNRLYYIDSFNAKTYEMDKIIIVEYDSDQNVIQKIEALKGIWTKIAWKFINCRITTYVKEDMNTIAKVKIYDEKLMGIKETPRDFLKQRLNIKAMNIRQLKEYIKRFSKSGATNAINRRNVDLHQKIAFPIRNLVIVLVGLPFALMIKSRKRSSFVSVGIAVAIGFLYYVANAVFVAFGYGGLLPPIISAWSAPILFTIIALALMDSYL